MIPRLLTWLFGPPEEINGAERCPTYLWRWHLTGRRGVKSYLHRFVGEDWSRDLHDHPRRFISVGLWGSYMEQTPDGAEIFRAPWVRSFPPEHRHRLRALGGECWTLVIVLPVVRDWGFWHEGRWVQWERYVKSEAATASRSCP